MKTILQQAFEMTDHRVRSYSGRGMYGRECLGVTVDCAVTDCILDAIEAAIENDLNVSVLLEEARDARQDAMGTSSILYWPNIPYAE